MLKITGRFNTKPLINAFYQGFRVEFAIRSFCSRRASIGFSWQQVSTSNAGTIMLRINQWYR